MRVDKAFNHDIGVELSSYTNISATGMKAVATPKAPKTCIFDAAPVEDEGAAADDDDEEEADAALANLNTPPWIWAGALLFDVLPAAVAKSLTVWPELLENQCAE